MTHTPGPWRHENYSARQDYDIVGPNGEDLAFVNPTDGGDDPIVYPVEANARLIAAAPDLLEALKAVVSVADRKTIEFDLAHAAIAKATALFKATRESPMDNPPLPRHKITEGIGHPDRGTTVVEAIDLNCDGDETGIPLAALVDDLNDLLESIPAEYRDSAKLNIKAYGDYASASANVTWQRPETDDELNLRRRWLKGTEDESDARDRREFERLKSKFLVSGGE